MTFYHHISFRKPFGFILILLFWRKDGTGLLITSFSAGYVDYADSFERGWLFFFAWPQKIDNFKPFKGINLRYGSRPLIKTKR